MAADARLLAQAGALSAGLLAEGSLRCFTFSVDLRKFEAGPRLPLGLATVVLELELPSELAAVIQASNGRLPPRLAPLCTQAVQVARGSETALPGGHATCEFEAGLMSIATLLARGPVMTTNVFHKERLADDLLLGRAHIPLAPLLQESWVEGRAGVYALVPAPGGEPGQHERVQVGTLHLVMSLEEVGPVAAPAAAAPAPPAVASVPAVPLPVAAPPAAAPAAAAEAQNGGQHLWPRPASAAGGEQLAAATAALQLEPELAQRPVAATAAALAAPALPPQLPAPAAPADLLVGGPEFEAAWELELWKREEEARWRRELKEREAKRMAALEDTWRRREAERDAEAASLRSDFSALEAKARAVLAAAEERERKVVAAEEAAVRRRRELEREHAGSVAEAEAAVRRLQTECQHQLELEQQRREALGAQKAAAEQRAAAAEAKAAAAERALAALREEHAASEAGRLEGELATAQQQLAAAQARATKAADAKRQYKAQVVRLAQEVAALQQQLAELAGVKRRQLDAELARLSAEEAALAARRDAADLGALHQQLRSLQAGGSGCGCGGKENSQSSAAGRADRPGAAAQGSAGAAAAGAPCPVQAQAPLVLPGDQATDAVHRLLQERGLLLDSGAYAAEDPLIQQLDQRIRECAALAQAG